MRFHATEAIGGELCRESRGRNTGEPKSPISGTTPRTPPALLRQKLKRIDVPRSEHTEMRLVQRRQLRLVQPLNNS